jgi:lipid II:glycine glycyltransferase (peptidoglycan interpeptide bridge formation enzyme)
MLAIRAASVNNEKIVFHSYVTTCGRARLLHSASLFRESDDSAYRNLVGRANRLLHWDDICYFKNEGCRTYDLGGISMDKSNMETQAINKFKESFGAAVIKEYKSYVPASFKGLIYLCGKKLLRKI